MILKYFAEALPGYIPKSDMAQKVATPRKMKSRQETTSLGQIATGNFCFFEQIFYKKLSFGVPEQNDHNYPTLQESVSRHVYFAILRKFYILNQFKFAFLSTTTRKQ